jgi:hypothetical protein
MHRNVKRSVWYYEVWFNLRNALCEQICNPRSASLQANENYVLRTMVAFNNFVSNATDRSTDVGARHDGLT